MKEILYTRIRDEFNDEQLFDSDSKQITAIYLIEKINEIIRTINEKK